MLLIVKNCTCDSIKFIIQEFHLYFHYKICVVVEFWRIFISSNNKFAHFYYSNNVFVYITNMNNWILIPTLQMCHWCHVQRLTRTDTRLSYVWFYFVVKLVSLHNQTLEFLFILSTFCTLHWLHPVNPKRTSPALSSLLNISRKSLTPPPPYGIRIGPCSSLSYHRTIKFWSMKRWCNGARTTRWYDSAMALVTTMRWYDGNKAMLASSHHRHRAMDIFFWTCVVWRKRPQDYIVVFICYDYLSLIKHPACLQVLNAL